MNIARDEYFIFVDEFPESKYVKEVKRDFKQISSFLGLDDKELSSIN